MEHVGRSFLLFLRALVRAVPNAVAIAALDVIHESSISPGHRLGIVASVCHECQPITCRRHLVDVGLTLLENVVRLMESGWVNVVAAQETVAQVGAAALVSIIGATNEANCHRLLLRLLPVDIVGIARMTIAVGDLIHQCDARDSDTCFVHDLHLTCKQLVVSLQGHVSALFEGAEAFAHVTERVRELHPFLERVRQCLDDDQQSHTILVGCGEASMGTESFFECLCALPEDEVTQSSPEIIAGLVSVLVFLQLQFPSFWRKSIAWIWIDWAWGIDELQLLDCLGEFTGMLLAGLTNPINNLLVRLDELIRSFSGCIKNEPLERRLSAFESTSLVAVCIAGMVVASVSLSPVVVATIRSPTTTTGMVA